MHVEFDDEQFDTLICALGMATGAALRDKNREQAHRFMRLVNHVEKENPDWKPYEVPDDPKQSVTGAGSSV